MEAIVHLVLILHDGSTGLSDQAELTVLFTADVPLEERQRMQDRLMAMCAQFCRQQFATELLGEYPRVIRIGMDEFDDGLEFSALRQTIRAVCRELGVKIQLHLHVNQIADPAPPSS